jgi:hypothetical protein
MDVVEKGVEDVEDYDVDIRNNVVNKCCKQSKS